MTDHYAAALRNLRIAKIALIVALVAVLGNLVFQTWWRATHPVQWTITCPTGYTLTPDLRCEATP
jgi:hypothetical protein